MLCFCRAGRSMPWSASASRSMGWGGAPSVPGPGPRKAAKKSVEPYHNSTPSPLDKAAPWLVEVTARAFRGDSLAQNHLQMLEQEQKLWESLRKPSPPIARGIFNSQFSTLPLPCPCPCHDPNHNPNPNPGPAPKTLSMQVRGVFASSGLEHSYSITNKRNVNMPDIDAHGVATTVGMLKNTIVASVNNSIGDDGYWLAPSDVLVIAEATSGGWEVSSVGLSSPLPPKPVPPPTSLSLSPSSYVCNSCCVGCVCRTM
jgi:hypothetical protein